MVKTILVLFPYQVLCHEFMKFKCCLLDTLTVNGALWFIFGSFTLGVTLSYSCFLLCCENENDKIKQNVQLHYLRTDFIVVIHESNGLEIKSPVLFIYGQTFCK